MASKLDYTAEETETTNKAILMFTALHRLFPDNDPTQTPTFIVEARFDLFYDDGLGSLTRTGSVSFNSTREVGEVTGAQLIAALPSAQSLESEIIDWMQSNGFLPAGTKN